MQKKVLIADDSLTIQKVIRITLSGSPYETYRAASEEMMFEELREDTDLVLLDFSLSDNNSGYDLCQQIKAKRPSTKVVMLFSNFDTINDRELKQAGCDDKIIKPFEGQKLLKIVRDLLENGASKTFEEESRVSLDDQPSEQEEDWVLSNPGKNFQRDSDGATVESGLLQSEVVDWGFSKPPVIGTSEATDWEGDIPPKIDEEKDTDPQSGAYLDLDLESEIESEAGSQDFWTDIPEEATKSLPSFDQLKSKVKEQFASTSSNFLEERKIQHVDDFWKADPFPAEKVEIESEKGQSAKKKKEKDKSVAGPELEALVKKYVEEYCRESIERIAWEIIPDLAENLIKEELRRLAQSAMDEH